jgi:hypothetical protein
MQGINQTDVFRFEPVSAEAGWSTAVRFIVRFRSVKT